MSKKGKNDSKWTRREFVKGSVVAGSVAGASLKAQQSAASASRLGPSATLVDDFRRPDSLHAGNMWETLNPGYWKLEHGALRRRLRNFGDRVVPMQLPWDWQLALNNPEMILDAVDLFSEDLGDLSESIRAKASGPEALSEELRMKLLPELDYFKDPTLPEGMLWRSDWKLRGNFGVRMEATIKRLNPGPGEQDDAYRSINSHLAGPTSRHQLMRHWVVMNPGDHDFGMDDLAGPIQHALRHHRDLSPIGDYLQGNMQIVAHLMLADESPSATETPRFWRQWKMPDRDFTLVTVDSRLWRSTAEKRLWRDNQWADSTDVFDRHSPLRTILGEEQFAWLQQIVHTDSSQVICVSGINVLNTIYNQLLGPPPEGEEDFRVFENNCFDFAGWRSVPAKRLLELFGSREGIVAVYGDLHHAGISRNVHNNVIEAHFGHTGNSGYLRSPKHDFARRMTDFNGEEVEVIADYHQYWNSFELTRRPQRSDRRRDAQNFMEMTFDTRLQDPGIQMKIRHTLDSPEQEPRGGGKLDVPLFATGRRPTSSLPEVKTLPSADVVLYSPDGAPIRGTRTREDGSLGLQGLVDIPPGTEITLVCRKGTEIDAQTLRTLPPDRG